MTFERKAQKLASTAVYRQRLAKSAVAGSIMVIVSLAVGMAGYAFFEDLGWIDSFVNAAMILSGMGPLHDPESTGGKLFAGIYAIYSGFAVLVIAAVTFAPAIHRMLHRFHMQTEEDEEQDEKHEDKAAPQGNGGRRKRRR
jgi:hypothetical protein